MTEGFLSRWARLKRSREQDVATASEEKPPLERVNSSETAAPPEAPAGAPGSAAEPGVPIGTTAPDASHPGKASVDAAPVDPNNDLPPIASLTPASDFTPFLRRGVTTQARNAALKKLFTDPHYNVMDGLDVYIDDYNVTEPIPEHVLARLLREHASPVLAATGQPGALDEAGQLAHEGTADIAHGNMAISGTAAPAGLEDPVDAGEKASPGETALDDEKVIPGETPIDGKASPGETQVADEKAGTDETTSADEKQGIGEATLAQSRPGAESRFLEPVVASGGTLRSPDDHPIKERWEGRPSDGRDSGPA